MHFTRSLIDWAWFAWIAIWIIASGWSARTVARQSGSSRRTQLALLVIGVVFLGLANDKAIAGSLLAYRLVPATRSVAIVAAALVMLGLGFSVWARFWLGRNWSGTVTLKEEHELVEKGPYRFVRHPIYTGLLFALLGTALAKPTIAGLIGLCFLIFGLLLKMRAEEAILTDHFGDSYRDYRRRVKGLIPFVW